MPRIYKLLGVFALVGILAAVSFLVFSFKQRIWRDNSRLTYYSLSPRAQIQSLDPITKEGVLIDLPSNLEIESVNGRGNWLLGKIVKAGNKRWVSESLIWHLGIADLKSGSELTFWDWWRLWRIRNSIVQKNLDLTQTGLATLEKTSDGLDIYRLSPHWYLQSPDLFASTGIIRQNLLVTVINTTPVTGLGNRVARGLEAVGIKVQTLSSSGENLPRCQLTATSEVQKLSGFLLIKKLFGCESKLNDAAGREIRLELGQDWAQKLFG